jgi:hypothetical protein
MTLFGYLFDSNFKEQRERDKQRGEAPDEVSSDPFQDANTVRRLREDMSRLMVLNRALIRLLIDNQVITLSELTALSKEIDLIDHEKEPADRDMEMCKDCGRHSYRARANCVYCGALQL